MSDRWAGDIARRVADQIKALRGDRSGQWLSDRTDELGHRVSRSTISELENGKRATVAVDALIVLAAALGVAVADLLYPGPEEVEALPGLTVQRFRAIEALAWGPPGWDQVIEDEKVRGSYFSDGLTPEAAALWKRLAESALIRANSAVETAAEAVALSVKATDALQHTTAGAAKASEVIANLQRENDLLRAQLLGGGSVPNALTSPTPEGSSGGG